MDCSISTNSRQRNNYTLMHIILLVLSTIVIGFFYINLMEDTSIYIISLVNVISVCWCFYSWAKLTGDFFDIYTVVLTTLVLFNSSLTFLNTFHIEYNLVRPIEIDNKTMYVTIAFVTLFILIMHLTMLVCYRKHSKNDNKLNIDLSAIKTIAGILFITCLIPTFYTAITDYIVYRKYGYMYLYQREFSFGIYNILKILQTFFIPSIILLCVAYSKLKRKYVFLGFALIYSLIYLLIGKRSEGITALAGLLLAWDLKIKHISRKYVIILTCMITFLIFPIIGQLRTGPQNGSGINIGNSNLVTKSISEMGSTMLTLSYTIVTTPSVIEYRFGKSYFYGASTLFPNFFWSIHPAKAMQPALNLVEIVNPYTFNNGGSYGYSLITEAYLNFGYFGVLVGVLFGLALSKLYSMSKSWDILKVAFVCITTNLLILYTRNDSFSIFRPLLWNVILPLAAIQLISKKNTKEDNA